MAGKLIMTRGLPASGKSTWAATTGFKVVNKDDIRARRCRPWSEAEEQEVLKIRDREIGISLSHGDTVISSDTNFAPKHEKAFRRMCAKYKSEFEIKDFTEVPVETCIERDKGREDGQGYVGEAVIRKMAAQYLGAKPDYTPYVAIPGTPDAIICDIDGTVALCDGIRSPYDTAKADKDLPNLPIINLLQLLEDQGDTTFIYVSGRDAAYRDLTIAWLKANNCPYDELLFMRPEGDTRNDAIIKLELFNNHIRKAYNVKFVLDDRDRVVEMWRKLGLTCLQVAPGAF